MNVAENLQRIMQAKKDLKTVINSIRPSIRNEELKDYTITLSKMFGLSRVVFVDYDGTVLKDEYCFVGDDLVPPIVPDHTDEGLVFTEWNWDTTVEKVGPVMMVIGACYTTVDGLNHIHIRLTTDLVFSMYFQFLTTAGNTPFSYTLDWGDGSEPDTYAANGTRSHTYSQSGDYVIKIAITMPDTNGLMIMGSTTFPKHVTIRRLYIVDRLQYFDAGSSSLINLSRLVLPQKQQLAANISLNYYTNVKAFIVPKQITALTNCNGSRLEIVSLPKNITNITNVISSQPPLQLISLSHLTHPVRSDISFINNIVTPDYYLQLSQMNSQMYAGNTEIINIDLSSKIGNQPTAQKMFKNCVNLKTIKYFDGLLTTGSTIVQDYFAENCFELESITNLQHVTLIEDYAFRNCFKLNVDFTQFTVLTEIKSYAFQNCLLDIDFIIPPAITKIGSMAFANTKIRSFIVPEGSVLATLDGSAFTNCTELTTIVLRNTSNGYMQFNFSNCYKLTSFTVHEGLFYSGQISEAVQITEVVLPTGVKFISPYAFRNCTNLANINFPSTLLNIQNNAFYNCVSLAIPIILPEGLTSLSASAFEGCINIPSFQLPSTLATANADNIFKNCKTITEIVFPDALKVFGRWMLDGCDNLQTVVFGNAVTTLGYYMFKSCISLQSITVPTTVTLIPDGLFYLCTALIMTTVPDNITHMGVSAFEGCTSLTEFVMPPLETYAATSLFKDCLNLVSIDFTRCTITRIDNYAFSNTGLNGSLVIDFSNYVSIPTLSYSASQTFGRTSGFQIKVPNALLTAWKAATNWSTISACIIGV